MSAEHVSAFDEILNAVAPPPKVNGARVISPMRNTDDQPEEPAMPRGIYERKPRADGAAPKKRGRAPKVAAPPVAKKPRGQYSGVLADLHAKRDQIDAAIEAIEALA